MTLRKMYLVPAEHYEHGRPQPPPPMKSRPSVKTKRAAKRKVKKHSHDKWVALRTKLMEANMKESDLISRFADFLRKVLPQPTPPEAPLIHPKTETFDIAETPRPSAIDQQTEPPSVGEASTSYEVSKRRLSSGDVDTSDDDDLRGFYEVVSPYLNKMRFLDEQYGIRRDGNNLMIGNSDVIADEKGDITIAEKRFRGTKGLWELLTRKNVNSDVITNSDSKAYKRILELTNAHLV